MDCLDFRWYRNIIFIIRTDSDFFRTMDLGPADSELFPRGRQLFPYNNCTVHFYLQVREQKVTESFNLAELLQETFLQEQNRCDFSAHNLCRFAQAFVFDQATLISIPE